MNDVKVWNLNTGQELLSLPHEGPEWLQMTFDGARLRIFDRDSKQGARIRTLDGSP